MDNLILNNVKLHNKSGEFHIYVKNGNIDKISKKSFTYPNINKFESLQANYAEGLLDGVQRSEAVTSVYEVRREK